MPFDFKQFASKFKKPDVKKGKKVIDKKKKDEYMSVGPSDKIRRKHNV